MAAAAVCLGEEISPKRLFSDYLLMHPMAQWHLQVSSHPENTRTALNFLPVTSAKQTAPNKDFVSMVLVSFYKCGSLSKSVMFPLEAGQIP